MIAIAIRALALDRIHCYFDMGDHVRERVHHGTRIYMGVYKKQL